MILIVDNRTKEILYFIFLCIIFYFCPFSNRKKKKSKKNCNFTSCHHWVLSSNLSPLFCQWLSLLTIMHCECQQIDSVAFLVIQVIFSLFTIITFLTGLILTASYFSKAQYSLFVLKVPLNPH